MGSFVALVGGVCLAVFSVMTTQPYLFAKDFNEVTCTSEGYITCEYLTQLLKYHNLYKNPAQPETTTTKKLPKFLCFSDDRTPIVLNGLEVLR